MLGTIERGVDQGSDLVIPAVPGEFYGYSAEFTNERPLYALMKCKANKSRPLADAGKLGREANLLFLFGESGQAQVCAVDMAQASGLLTGVADENPFGKTWIAVAGITVEQFGEIRSHRDVASLVGVCRAACSKRETSSALGPDTVIAIMTDDGKFGLFFIKEFAQSSIHVEACHILL